MNVHPAHPDGVGAETAPLRLWIPLAALAVLSLVSAFLMAPLSGAAYGGQTTELARSIRTGLWVVAAAAPVLAMVKGIVLAGVAWAILVLWGETPVYRRLVGVLLTGEVILGVQGIWMAALLHLRGVDTITAPSDLRIVTGLDLVFPDPATPWGAVAQTVTPFHAAWLVFLAWAFVRLGHHARVPAAVAALACWLPGPILALARTLAP